MNKKRPKVIIAHPNKQHSYKTAVALKEKGYLFQYITTVYCKKGTLSHFLCKILPNKYADKLARLYCPDLDDSDVRCVCEWGAVKNKLLTFIPRLNRKTESRRVVMLKRFNRKLAKTVKKELPDVLIVYDTLSGDALEEIKRSGIPVKTIVDLSAPFYLDMLDVMRDYSVREEIVAAGMSDAFLGKASEDRAKQAKKELDFADGFLVASEYTANSLVKFGADRSRIYKCIYGIDNNENACRTDNREGTNPLKGIYIGNVSVLKGIPYLNSALEKCSSYIEGFDFFGAVQDEQLIIHDDERIHYHGFSAHEEVIKACRNADFAVFPSLFDGFGFAVSECLSQGVPVICSRNAGVSDLIQDGVNGYLVDAGDADSISKKIRYWYENNDVLKKMKENACQSIREYTWNRYSESIIKLVNDILSKRR